MVDLSVVIVSWNVGELLQRCLSSVAGSPTAGRSIETIVVDNASSDGSPEMVSREFPDVHLIANQCNVGFARASNQGLLEGSGTYVLFLNPDTEVLGDALLTMVRYLEVHREVGALGPQLLYGDGSIQSSRRRFPTMATGVFESTLLEQWWPHNRWIRRYRMAEQSDSEAQCVDWVVGACLLVRSVVLDEVGPFDEGYFMYSEELDLCRRIHDAGWKVAYVPDAQVVHHEGKSSEQVVAARHTHFQTSKLRYYRKYHGRAQSELLRTFLLATYVYQVVEEAVKWLVGHKRPLRAARLRAYTEVLRTRLAPRGA